jgi:hypothetical protein
VWSRPHDPANAVESTIYYAWIEAFSAVRLAANMRWLEQNLNQPEREAEGVPSHLKDHITANIAEFVWSIEIGSDRADLTDPHALAPPSDWR